MRKNARDIIIANLRKRGFDSGVCVCDPDGVKAVITAYLQKYGYDGLCNSENSCGCLLDDLMPCGHFFDCCLPGHKQLQDDGDGDWVIVPKDEVKTKSAKVDQEA